MLNIKCESTVEFVMRNESNVLIVMVTRFAWL